MSSVKCDDVSIKNRENAWEKQDKQCTYNVIFRKIREITKFYSYQRMHLFLSYTKIT